MRTLQEKYNGINEGKFTKDQFLRDARMEQPSLVTQYNGYDDAVKILKNRGMIRETYSTEESFKDYSDDALADMIINSSRYEGNEEITARVKQELARRKEANLNEAKQEEKKELATVSHVKKLVQAAKEGNKSKKSILAGFAGADINYKVTTAEPDVIKWHYDKYDANLSGEIKLKPEQLDEARLTNKSLTDYRYKPTNDMDKYPYEQILRGLRVELEGLSVLGTPTPEEYKKALGKVLKNLEKDTIFYTNQVAGVSKKVDLHDKMVDVKKDNAVDKFNGLKKAQLKEAIKGVIKNILSENSDPDLYDQDEERQERANDHGDYGPVSDFGDYYPEPDEDLYEMQGPKTDAEYKAELREYLKDNQIYGYTDMLFDILTGPDEEQVADNLADFLDDHQIYGYNKGLLAIFRDYANDNENQYIPDEDEDDDIPHPRGYEEASDEEDFDDLFKENKLNERIPDDTYIGDDTWYDEDGEKELRAEWEKYQATCHPEDKMSYMEWRSEQGLDEAIDTEADKNMVRKLMAMYETEPSFFENLHQQAQVQANRTKDIKFKHLLSLFNRAKAGALQALSNQDRRQADSEGMDESISLKDIL